MIGASLRILAGAVVGSPLAFVLVVGVEGFSAVVHPLPGDFRGTMEEMCRHVERDPPWAPAAVVPMWAVAALAGTWVAQRVGDRNAAGTVGLLLFTALACNLSQWPYPIWLKAVNLLVIPAAIVAGSGFSGRRKGAGRVEVNLEPPGHL